MESRRLSIHSLAMLAENPLGSQSLLKTAAKKDWIEGRQNLHRKQANREAELTEDISTLLERGNLRKTGPQAHTKTTYCALNMLYFIPKIYPYLAMIPAPPVPVGWASSALNRSPALLSMSTRQFSPFGAPDTIYSLYALRVEAKTFKNSERQRHPSVITQV